MFKLPKPSDTLGQPLAVADVYNECILNFRPELKNRLQTILGTIVADATAYDTAAARAKLHTLPRKLYINPVTHDELVKVYTQGMVPKKRTGRHVYDQIINAPPNQRCPLCNVGTITTLDHHLPKAEYSQFTVMPNNLIPACTWCQGVKNDAYPVNEVDQTIHPYYDDFSQSVWLYAEVVECSPAAFRFSVRIPRDWTPIMEGRLNAHLKAFRLPELYASNAGSELAGIAAELRRLFDSGGYVAVRTHLDELAVSWEAHFKNSWKAAMFRAGARSEWFCNGGFAQGLGAEART